MTREEYYEALEKSKELYHHGIKGQKWGIENGPPYPLNGDGKAALREQKKVNRIVKKMNDLQFYRDKTDIHKQHAKEHPVANRVSTGLAIGMSSLVTAGFTAFGTIMGGPIGGVASGAASAGLFYGTLISNISYNKSIPKKINSYINELDSKGYTVDQIPTKFTYSESYNGSTPYTYGTINTKRYKLHDPK